MTSQSLLPNNQTRPQLPQSCLDVNEVMTTMIKRAKQGMLNPNDKGFIHGMTWQEVARTFGHVQNYMLKRYDNRQRDLYQNGLAGKHYVHGEIHYYPLNVEVDHAKCVGCSQRK